MYYRVFLYEITDIDGSQVKKLKEAKTVTAESPFLAVKQLLFDPYYCDSMPSGKIHHYVSKKTAGLSAETFEIFPKSGKIREDVVECPCSNGRRYYFKKKYRLVKADDETCDLVQPWFTSKKDLKAYAKEMLIHIKSDHEIAYDKVLKFMRKKDEIVFEITELHIFDEELFAKNFKKDGCLEFIQDIRYATTLSVSYTNARLCPWCLKYYKRTPPNCYKCPFGEKYGICRFPESLWTKIAYGLHSTEQKYIDLYEIPGILEAIKQLIK